MGAVTGVEPSAAVVEGAVAVETLVGVVQPAATVAEVALTEVGLAAVRTAVA
jgi:hypothetical protein